MSVHPSQSLRESLAELTLDMQRVGNGISISLINVKLLSYVLANSCTGKITSILVRVVAAASKYLSYGAPLVVNRHNYTFQ